MKRTNIILALFMIIGVLFVMVGLQILSFGAAFVMMVVAAVIGLILIALTSGKGKKAKTEEKKEEEVQVKVPKILAQKTAAQVALALENIRLLEETRERARQEQMLSEFSARLGQSVDLDSLLQTAVRELAALPEVADASIFLNPSAPAAEKGSA